VLAYPVAATGSRTTKDQATIASLKALAGSLPPVHGSAAQPPLIPNFVPDKALVPGSVRYATGPATYQAEGGVLPANSIAWDKAGEAITARYTDKRGEETLTLLLYPTPQIAGNGLKSVQAQLPGLGPKFATAQSRREMELVMVASGTFPPDQAQKMLENIHMKQLASVDKAIEINAPNVEIKKTASLLVNIAVLSGVLMLAAVLLGFFLGGGRDARQGCRYRGRVPEPASRSTECSCQVRQRKTLRNPNRTAKYG
jgi:hypothetical protein